MTAFKTEIEPFDTLFFKDGKSFDAADSSAAEVVFPPSPSVFFGALRTAFSRKNSSGIPLLNTEIDPTNNLIIHQITLADKQTTYFPIPMDCIVDKNGDIHTLELEEMQKSTLSSHKLPAILKSNHHFKSHDEGFWYLDNTLFDEYLSGKTLNGKKAVNLAQRIVKETKIGNKGDQNTGTVEEGGLYTKQVIRLVDLHFEIIHSGLDIKRINWLMLGGESRFAALRSENIEFTVNNISLEKNKLYKLYLHTPSIFLNTEKECISEPNSFLAEKGLSLLAAATGRAQYIGGWDMQKRKPKPMYKAVSAGSVFYIKNESDQVISIPQQGSISNRYTEQGFGLYNLISI